MISLLQLEGLKQYKVTLKEHGNQVKIWGNIRAINALSAINSVCIEAKPYQQWIARRLS